MIELQPLSITSSTGYCGYIYRSSTVTPSSSVSAQYFLQSMIANNVSTSTNSDSYFMELKVVASGSNWRIYYNRDYTYKNYVQFNLLFISKNIATIQESYAQWGSSASKIFSSNFGVDTANYGWPSSGKLCLQGLSYVGLYFYRGSSNSLSSSFLFSLNETEITDIKYNYLSKFKLNVACFGIPQSNVTQN